MKEASSDRTWPAIFLLLWRWHLVLYRLRPRGAIITRSADRGHDESAHCVETWMAREDSPQSSSDHEEPATDNRRAELEALFKRWDQRAPGTTDLSSAESADEARRLSIEEALDANAERSFWQLDPVRFRFTLTVILCILAGYLMWSTRSEFSYWMSDSEPIELGDLAERYKAGERDLELPSNRYVQLAGLYSTYEATPRSSENQASQRYFISANYDIVVRTSQPFLVKPTRALADIDIDGALVPLLVEKRAFPRDLISTFSGKGRLIHATDATERSGSHVLNHYAGRTGRPVRTLWFFLDGDTPSSYGTFGLVWALAPILPLISLLSFIRALVRKRRTATLIEAMRVEYAELTGES